jgi:hypothetical protein
MTTMHISNGDLVNGQLTEDLLSRIRSENITSLDLSDCSRLTSLPENLPSGLTSLNLSWCTSLRSLPKNLPSGLTSLDLSMCASLASLPENLPSGLASLKLSGCKNLTSLPENLPSGLTDLDLYLCENLASLPESLPSGLTYLYLEACTSLRSLPENLPSGLTSLNLFGCENLQFTEELINRLEALEANDCEIRYPSHYLATNTQAARAEIKLDRAIEAYKESHANEPKPSSIKTLFSRYLTEGVGQRGSDQARNSKQALKEIVATTAPILNLFTKNPNHLKWAEEIAKNYLDGCVNQPVAGWLEISAWASIAEAPTVEEKLEASNHLRAFESINSYVANLPASQKPGVGVEVEFFNALFREVHKKLLDNGNISKPWLGVPKGVAYEGMVKKNLTSDVIESAHERVKNALSQSPEDVARYFCEDLHQLIWADIAFAPEVEVINKIFEEKLERIEELLKNPESAEAHAFRKSNPIAGESFPTLEQIQTNIPNERNAAILTQSKKLTFAALERGEEESKSDLDSNEWGEGLDYLSQIKISLDDPNQVSEEQKEEEVKESPKSSPKTKFSNTLAEEKESEQTRPRGSSR